MLPLALFPEREKGPGGEKKGKELTMTILLIIAIVLFVLWLLGFSTRFVASGLIHIVLVIAVILFVFWLLRVAFRIL